MNHDGRWLDACVHNVSSRGMLIAADGTFKPGDYLDIRRGTLVIIARVVWRKDRFFGVRTQDRISVDALVGEPRRTTKPTQPGDQAADRRSSSRYVTEAKAAHRLERSRQISSAMQYVLLGGTALAAALAVGSQVYGLLDHSMGQVSSVLSGQETGPAPPPSAR